MSVNTLLKDYIKNIIDNTPTECKVIHFDIQVGMNNKGEMIVHSYSGNRLRFSIRK